MDRSSRSGEGRGRRPAGRWGGAVKRKINFCIKIFCEKAISKQKNAIFE